MNSTPDTTSVRLVIFGLVMAVMIGMTIEGVLINRLIGAPPDQVKEIAIVMLAFGQLPSAALGALSAFFVSTRSGVPSDAMMTSTTTVSTDPPPPPAPVVPEEPAV